MSAPMVAMIHGIRTGYTKPAWPWLFQPWARDEGVEVMVQAEHYRAVAFPWWNHLITNPIYARGLANRLLLVNEGVTNPLKKTRLCLVGHSNGANIAVLTAKRLIARGETVECLVLIGAAVRSDVVKSGLLELVRTGRLKRVICYASRRDTVVRWLDWLPGSYGSLGSRGFKRYGDAHGEVVREDEPLQWPDGAFTTRRWPFACHGRYFSEDLRDQVFRCLARDLKLEPEDAWDSGKVIDPRWETDDDVLCLGDDR